MKFIVTVDKLEHDEKQKLWDVVFTIEHDGGITHMVPITIFDYELDQPVEHQAILLAARKTLPGQFALAYSNKKEQATDFFDTLEQSLNKDANNG